MSIEIQPGQHLDGLVVGPLIGEGGFGRVYAAMDPALERAVVIKVLTAADPGFLARFRDEARLLARIQSPHVVQIHRLGALPDGTPYLVMECVAGGSLQVNLQRRPIPLAEGVRIIADVLLGLDAVHRQGVIHRDVKASNILLDLERGRAALCDFGIARSMEPMEAEAGPTQGLLLGSPHFVAPERLLRARAGGAQPEDPRSDLYSVGVLLYRLLTGTRPFSHLSRDPVALTRALLHEDPPPPGPEVPEPLAEVCLHLLARNPDARYATARAALRALTRAWARTRRLAAPTSLNIDETLATPGLLATGPGEPEKVTVEPPSRQAADDPPTEPADRPRRSRLKWGWVVILALAVALGALVGVVV